MAERSHQSSVIGPDLRCDWLMSLICNHYRRQKQLQQGKKKGWRKIDTGEKWHRRCRRPVTSPPQDQAAEATARWEVQRRKYHQTVLKYTSLGIVHEYCFFWFYSQHLYQNIWTLYFWVLKNMPGTSAQNHLCIIRDCSLLKWSYLKYFGYNVV